MTQHPTTTRAEDLPGLPEGFWSTFKSQMVNAGGGVRLHAVVGGEGPPVLVVNGWPLTWYAGRHVISALAEEFTVVALEQRGVGQSDKPPTGYDSGTLARDLLAAMRSLGHERFAVVADDVGAWTGFALASDHPTAVARYVHAEVVTPGLCEDMPLLLPDKWVDRMWHMTFNRASGSINEEMVAGREEIYFGHQFETKAKAPGSVAPQSVDIFVDAVRPPAALHASFEFYRSIGVNMQQNLVRRTRQLSMPVLGLGCEHGAGELTIRELEGIAADLEGIVIPDGGHYLMEEDPVPVTRALLEFLSPYKASHQTSTSTTEDA